MELALVLAALAFVAVVLLAILYLSVRVVQQYEQMVVFRLGKTNESLVRGPGLPPPPVPTDDDDEDEDES